MSLKCHLNYSEKSISAPIESDLRESFLFRLVPEQSEVYLVAMKITQLLREM